MQGFDDIAIVDLDLAKTTWSRVHSSMRTLYLRLTREPETGWVRFFHEERESRIMLKRHGLWIEDGYIVFDCLLEDVEEHHIPDFQLSIDYANEKYRAYLAERREQGLQLRDDARVEEEELAALRERIRGGAPVAGPGRPVAMTRMPAEPAAPNLAATPPLVTTTVSWSPATTAAAATTAAVPAWVAASKAAREKLATAPPLLAATVSAAPVPAAAPEATHVATAEQATQPKIDVAPAVPERTSEPTAQAPPEAEPLAAKPEVAADNKTEAPTAAERRPEGAVSDIADFNAKREEWRARFRAAMAASRPKEPARGND